MLCWGNAVNVIYIIVHQGVKVIEMQIHITPEVKRKLDERKIIPEEPYYKVITRLLEATQ